VLASVAKRKSWTGITEHLRYLRSR